MKLIFSNLWYKNPRIPHALDRLKQADADLIVLSELPRFQIPSVTERLKDYPYFEIVSPNPVGSLAIFSKYPISDFEELNQGDFMGRPQGIMHIGYRSGFKLFVVHASAPWTYPRFLRRNRQLSAISDLAKTVNEPLLMVGDFNASHRRKEMRAFKTDCALAECRDGKRTQASWPMIGRFWSLDHMFYSSHFEMKQFACLNFVYSDHLPIFGEFELN